MKRWTVGDRLKVAEKVAEKGALETARWLRAGQIVVVLAVQESGAGKAKRAKSRQWVVVQKEGGTPVRGRAPSAWFEAT